MVTQPYWIIVKDIGTMLAAKSTAQNSVTKRNQYKRLPVKYADKQNQDIYTRHHTKFARVSVDTAGTNKGITANDRI